MTTQKTDKEALISKLRSSHELTDDEKSCLIELLRKQNHYGIVFEPQKAERAEKLMATQVPVLRRVEERCVGCHQQESIGHLLIEGDNLHTLTALNHTHRGRIDVIYIDPPYNTGHRDFTYNDTYMDADNSFRHSTWLTFMQKRLRLARELLSERGVIVVSIDHRELFPLGMLMDEVFQEKNRLGLITLINNLKGRSDDAHFATCNEFMLVYARHPERVQMNLTAIDDEQMDQEYRYADDVSRYKPVGFRKTGKESQREKRPSMYYPVLRKDGEFFSITSEEFSRIYDNEAKRFNDDYVDRLCQQYWQRGYEVFLPIDAAGNKGRWRWGFTDKFRQYYKTELCVNSENTLCTKMRDKLEDGTIRGKLSKTTWYKAEYDTGIAGRALAEMFGRKVFENPKSVAHIKDVLRLFAKDAVILDFFAGSGTTFQAALQLNHEDGGSRQCILATNNENGICRHVAYPRCRMVLEGYQTSRRGRVEGLGKGNSLHYYCVDFAERSR